jgi:hypothetical protein
MRTMDIKQSYENVRALKKSSGIVENHGALVEYPLIAASSRDIIATDRKRPVWVLNPFARYNKTKVYLMFLKIHFEEGLL